VNQRDLLVRIDSEFNDKGFKSAEASARAMVRELERQEKATRDLAQMQIAAQRENEQRHAQQMANMGELGRGFAAVGAAAAIGLGLAAKAASDWESAWAGVRKTVDGSDAEIASLEAELRGLAKTLPATHEEIAAVAEEAGALGVARGDLAAFTRTAIDLGETTNLSASEAANGLAKLNNIMGVLPTETDRAGAALVALGNNGASTEDEILAMSLRIAGAGRIAGMTEAQVLGLASGLSSVGLEAEAGGSAVSRVILSMSSSVDKGGESLQAFADVAGLTTEQFAERFRTDAAGALSLFVTGLGDMQSAGQSVLPVLDTLGLSEIRVRDTLLRSAGASDMLTASLDLGTRSWEENIALVDEANKRYETSEARIQIARNQLNDMAIDVGGQVLPAIAGAAERVGFLASAFQSLPEPVQTSVVVLGGAVAVLGTIGGLALMAIPKLAAMNATLAATGPAGAAAAAGLSRVGAALMGPWGLALTAATVALGIWAESQYSASQRADEFRATLDQGTGAITDQTRALIANRLESDGLLEGYGHLAGGVRMLTEAALGNEEVLSQLRSEQEANEEVLTRLAAKQGDLTAAEYAQLDAAQQSSDAYRGMFEALGLVTSELEPQIDKQKRLGEATEGTGDAASGATGETDELGRAIGETADEAAAAREEIDKLIESIENYGETLLEARDANRAYEGSLDDAEESLKSTREAMVAGRLEKQGYGTDEGDKEITKEATRAAEEWADAQIKAGEALDTSTEAGRRNEETLDAIATSALDAATANFANGESVADVSDKVLAARDDFVAMATRMGMSKDAANALADELGLTRTNVDRLADAVRDVPKSAKTKFSVDTEKAMAQIAAYRAAVAALPNTRIAFEGRLPSGGRDTSGGVTFGYGGYTGDAPIGAIVGGVHGQEFVSDANVTAQWRGLLEHMHAGGDPRSFLGLMSQPMPSMSSSVVGATSYAESYDQRVVAETLNVYANNPAEITRRARLAPYEANRRAS
jgi:TP901 family phage tail tape measure protein